MNDCVEWTGYIDWHGYGEKCVKGRKTRAHRWTWEQHNGPIPAGMVIMHLCDNPACVKLDHLRLGTQAENMADAKAKGRMTPPPVGIGERNNQAKLTAEQVREVRSSSASGVELARRFNVSPSAISLIRRNKKWLCVS